jgi:hypothetical protein
MHCCVELSENIAQDRINMYAPDSILLLVKVIHALLRNFFIIQAQVIVEGQYFLEFPFRSFERTNISPKCPV